MQNIIKVALLLLTLLGAYFVLDKFIDSDAESTEQALEDDHETQEKHDDDDDDDEENLVLIVDGNKAIRIEDDELEAFGVEVSSIETKQHKTETSIYAKVLDIKPILEAHTEYKQIATRLSGVRSSLAHQNKLVQRAEKLNQAKSLSTRELELIRSERSNVSSELQTLQGQLEDKFLTIQSEWGEKLGSHIVNGDETFKRIASHQLTLVYIALPREMQLDGNKDSVFIAPIPEREFAKEAKYLGRSSIQENSLLGEGHLFLLESRRLSPGMRMFAWLSADTALTQGVFIPESAVIWYANSPWFYINDDELFIRMKVEDALELDNGWLLMDSSLEGQALVIKGSQSLFSQEFKWAIPDEDDD